MKHHQPERIDPYQPERIDPWKLARELGERYRQTRYLPKQHALYMAAAGAAYYGELGREECNALYAEYSAHMISATTLTFRVNAAKLRAIVKLVEEAPELGCDLLARTVARWIDMEQRGAALGDCLVAVSRYQLRRLDRPLSDRALTRFIRKTKG